MATFRLSPFGDYLDIPTYRPDLDGLDNTFYLLKGEDVFYGGSGRETIYGGDGADFITSGAGDDTLRGDRGYDYLDGGPGADLIYAGAGNDTIIAEGDRVIAGAGHDYVALRSEDNLVSSVSLGTGSDVLAIEACDTYNVDHHAWVDVQDFKAADHLWVTAFDNAYGSYYEAWDVLDRLDRNDDGWIGAKDVEAFDDGDGFAVHVEENFLQLDVLDNSIVLHNLTKASLDFLV